MAGIDLLPGGVSPVPAGKPARNDTATDTTRNTNDPAFGSVLSDSMRPSSRKDSTPSSRDQDSSSPAPSRGPNPPSSTQPAGSSNKPGSKSDPRRSNDKGQTDKADSGSAAGSTQPTTTTTDNSTPTSSDATIESEVADVQKDEQQAGADTANAQTDTPPQPGVAPAQLVAGLLIASPQTPTQASPAATNPATPQNGPAQAQAAVSNVQKAPPGLAVALEQAANAGDQDANAVANGDSQPVATAIHSTQTGVDDANSAQEANTRPGTQPAVNVSTGVQAPPVVVSNPEVKRSKDAKSQTPDLTANDGKPVAPTSQSATDVSPTPSTNEGTQASAVAEPAPAPVVDAASVAAPATVAPTTGDVKPTADSTTRPKEEKDPQPGSSTSIGLGSDAPTETGIQVDLGIQTKPMDVKAGNPNGAAAALASIASEQTAPHAQDHETDSSTDPTGNVTGFAPDNTARRTDTTQVTGPGGAERSVNPSQVVDQVAHGIQLTHQSGERMQIHLRPPELGNLQIDVSMRDGMLSARLEAQSPATHQLLVDNLPQLKDSLTQQGLQVDRLEVDLSDSMRSDTSAGGNSGRSFEQQQNENLDGLWEQLPTNAAPQRRAQTTEPRVAAARGTSGPMLSLDITV